MFEFSTIYIIKCWSLKKLKYLIENGWEEWNDLNRATELSCNAYTIYNNNSTCWISPYAVCAIYNFISVTMLSAEWVHIRLYSIYNVMHYYIMYVHYSSTTATTPLKDNVMLEMWSELVGIQSFSIQLLCFSIVYQWLSCRSCTDLWTLVRIIIHRSQCRDITLSLTPQ